MLDTFASNTGQYLQTSPLLALAAVFTGGLLTASSPCVLAMIPLTMSFVAGGREAERTLVRAMVFSLVFVLGLAITFTALGMVAALAGKMYGDVPHAWNFVVAVVCALMGLHLMGVITLPMPSVGAALRPRTRGAFGALVLGLLFGVVSAPCAAPILIVLLTYLAGSGSSVPWGGVLLLVYALGHSVLIVIAGSSMGAARQLIENKKATRVLEVLRRGAGATVVLVGAYFAHRGLQ